MLTSQDTAALENKRRLRASLTAASVSLHPELNTGLIDLLPGDLYARTPVGKFEAVDSIRLVWISPDFFSFIPRPTAFSFTRQNGDVICPRHMFTDGGSIPRIAQPFAGLSAWGYGPAYILHDWIFDQHFCGATTYTLNDAANTLMEAIKTLMENNDAPVNQWAFAAIFVGVTSFIAANYWNAPNPNCPIPPDIVE